jgi:hypothetical protein
MSNPDQLFSASLAKDAVYRTGLRSFMEYRDLGVEKATHGQFREGEHTFRAGDCVLQPPAIVHNELDCSDDLEVLEVYSPAVHQTVVVDQLVGAGAR